MIHHTTESVTASSQCTRLKHAMSAKIANLAGLSRFKLAQANFCLFLESNTSFGRPVSNAEKVSFQQLYQGNHRLGHATSGATAIAGVHRIVPMTTPLLTVKPLITNSLKGGQPLQSGQIPCPLLSISFLPFPSFSLSLLYTYVR